MGWLEYRQEVMEQAFVQSLQKALDKKAKKLLKKVKKKRPILLDCADDQTNLLTVKDK